MVKAFQGSVLADRSESKEAKGEAPLKELLSSKTVRQLISYFFVGGTAALVEWSVFSLLEYLLDLPYLLASVLAFLVSTTVNWILGRTFTFKNSAYQKKKSKEAFLVFAASAVGLVFNLLLMLLFVDVIGMSTNFLKIVAKVLATGIVFIWNYLSRKLWIYRA